MMLMIQITRKIDYTEKIIVKDDDTICSSRDDSILKEYDDNWVEKKQVDKNCFTKIVEINLP